ncbi:uncharacterized protein EAF01_005581 [Botrytis porri]|uniref:uncharacterized protein n=1 Tax=Botrytis porri TaxID=87229 RepID=UPI001900D6A3|nr:uncharacterized protein EAF01_005581 [Botrytis porri]KAF7905060.1 hypothetical protein EAF01_005581 [Botrytis porri]
MTDTLRLPDLETDETLVKDEPATQSHENNGTKSASDSKVIPNDIVGVTKAFSEATLETPVIEKTLKEIWNEIMHNPVPKLARYRSLDITPDTSWFESTLSKVKSILEKTAYRGQSKVGDEDLAIERRNDILATIIEAALELGSYILDSPEISEKLAAQHDVQNQDHHKATSSVGTATNDLTEENIISASTLCENCSDAVASCQQVKVLEEPTQDSREQSIWFEYHSNKLQSLHYTIDLYERVHSFHLGKYEVKSGEKTVARLYVPIKSPPPTRRTVNFDASKAQMINAVSGWQCKQSETESSNAFISNKEWTEKVKEMCQTIGYELRRSQNDRGNPGNYNACHAEKQIIAYWIHNYVAKLPSGYRCTNWAKRDDSPPIKSEYYKDLYIVVSSSLCDCCNRFLNHVAAYYSISFTVHCPGQVIKFPDPRQVTRVATG